MRKIVFSAFVLCFSFSAFAQTDSTVPRRIIGPMQARAKDHFMIQLGAATWQNRPDSIKTAGLSRTFNMYLMLDFPFKTSPKLSVALGPGLATDHVFLDKMTAGIKDNTTSVIFKNAADTSHFKKYKVATAFLELPVELRFSSNPEADGKSFKVAIGAKVGTMIAAWVKGKTLEDKSGNELNDYLLKEKSKRFFNTTRISLTGRVGYGHFSAFTSYSLTSLFKEGVGPKMNAMSIGLTISGL
jgi:hypothetical protein